jgi:hypothetical protein
MEAIDREEREYERELLNAERRQADAIDHAADELFEQVEIIARGVLLANGFRQHNRGEWRRKRVERIES